jgi:hypothetical protein
VGGGYERREFRVQRSQVKISGLYCRLQAFPEVQFPERPEA